MYACMHVGIFMQLSAERAPWTHQPPRSRGGSNCQDDQPLCRKKEERAIYVINSETVKNTAFVSYPKNNRELKTTLTPPQVCFFLSPLLTSTAKQRLTVRPYPKGTRCFYVRLETRRKKKNGGKTNAASSDLGNTLPTI